MIQSPGFNPKNIIFAYVDDKPVGMIRIQKLPSNDRYELLDLAVLKNYWVYNIQVKLIKKALKFLEGVKPKYIRGETLSIETYVSAYKKMRFTPIRRVLRLTRDLSKAAPKLPINKDVKIVDIDDEDPEELVDVFLNSLQPYWDWWITDLGRDMTLGNRVKKWFAPHPVIIWLAAKLGDRIVGLTGFYIKGSIDGFFRAIVILRYRLMRIGYTLLNTILKRG